jgi:hypothetical protein
MGRHRKPGFTNMKMFASRIEESDYFKFEEFLKKSGKSLQQVMNLFVVQCISGSLVLSGSSFIPGEKNE